MSALDALFAREQFGIKLGLGAMRALCAALDHPERRCPVVHVAGTNGKGSVTAMVAHGLRAAGLRVGRYTSPHLVDLTERIAIDDAPITREVLEGAVAHVLDVEARERESGRIAAPMTFFELCTAAAFVVFAEAECDALVVEVGLGGRFDATNVVEPVVTAITNIAMDHMAHLGTTLAAIAFEKAGIVKPRVPVVIGAMADEARGAIVGVADAAGSPVVDALGVTRIDVTGHDETGRIRAMVQTSTADYGAVTLGLRGTHQVANASVAVAVLEAVAPPDERYRAAVRAALSDTRWPGRLDLFEMPSKVAVLLDAAHNEDGALALSQHLRAIGWRDVTCVFGVMRDKEADAMIDALAPLAASFVVTQAATPRARPADDLAVRVRQRCAVPTHAVADVDAALERALADSRKIVVCGSIYLLGDVLPRLERLGARRV